MLLILSILRRKTFVLIFVALTACLLPHTVFASSKVIAVVHSYHKDFRWVNEVNRGISDYYEGKKLFEIRPDPIFKEFKIVYFYMEAKDHPNDEKYLTNKGKEIISELEKLQPVVTIISDDEALKYVAAPLKQDPNYKFIFLGVNNDPRDYGVVSNYAVPEYNITGLISEHPFVYSLKLIMEIFPKNKGIYVLFDDSMTGRGIHKNLTQHLEKLDKTTRSHLKKTVVTNDWNLWKRTILDNQGRDNIFIFGAFYSLRDNGRLLSEKDVIDWIVAHSKVPELTVVSSHIADGLLLSISNPGYVHGYEASHMASAALTGTPISKIPIAVPKQKAVHVNMARAKQIGANIPVDIVVMSKYFNKLGY